MPAETLDDFLWTAVPAAFDAHIVEMRRELRAERDARDAASTEDEAAAHAARFSQLNEHLQHVHRIFHERGGWNRVYLVASARGHVHSDRVCRTLRPSTVLAWLTEYSGMSREGIVAMAGLRACHACYPEAPRG